jgi:DHA2 family multidrug resistance protein
VARPPVPRGSGGDQDAGWTPARSVAGGRNPWSIVGVISIATLMTTLDTSIVNVALDHIAGSLSTSYDEATWVTTSFLIATAIVVPISGWLADVIGRKPYYMASVAAFTLASFLCGVAPNLGALIVFRVIQGAAGGGLAAVEQSMLVDTFPPSRRGLAFAAYGLVVIVGPILGPVVGGLITDSASWRWCFFINVPIGALSLFLVHFFVDEPHTMLEERRERLARGLRIVAVGFLLLALFFGCLEVTLDRGQVDDWFGSTTIVTTATIAALAFVLFIPWELTREDPIVPIRMFGRRNFAIASIFLMLVGVILFGSTQFIPQLLQTVMGYTATQAGFALTLGGVATILVMPLAGISASRIDPRLVIGAAFLIQGFALWNMSHLDTDMDFRSAALARMYQSLGLPFLFVPITTIAYVGLRPEESNQASAMMNVARNLGGTIGISGVQTILAQRGQWHQARLAEGLDPLNPNFTGALSGAANGLQNFGASALSAQSEALGSIHQSLTRQATMLAYIDAFRVLMLVVFALTPLVFLMQGLRRGHAAPAAAGAAA